MNRNRKYISIYFKDGRNDKRKKRDLTISFTQDDPLYQRCMNLSSDEIKDIVGIKNYSELLDRARCEHRSLGNLIKHELRTKLL